MAVLPRLPIAVYRFHYRVFDDLAIPGNNGKHWHSAFGAALRRSVCVTGLADCRECRKLYECDYPKIFLGPRPPESKIMRKYSTIPMPHVLRCDAAATRVYAGGDDLTAGMVLVGDANKRLGSVIEAMRAAGTAGLPPGRVPVELMEVTQERPGIPIKLALEGAGKHLVGYPDCIPVPPPPEQIMLRIRTPMRFNGMKKRAPASEVVIRLIKNVIRRISLLQYFYTETPLDADFALLTEAAETIRILDTKSRFAWTEDTRVSASKSGTVYTSGWTGAVDICAEGLAVAWPYLFLGQWLNVGKNASMGYGRYELKAIVR